MPIRFGLRGAGRIGQVHADAIAALPGDRHAALAGTAARLMAG